MVHCQRAVALKPGSAEAHNNLGNASGAGQTRPKRWCIISAPSPSSRTIAEAHDNLGVALKEQGQLDEAQRACERALELAPRKGLYYRQLFDIRRVVAGDREPCHRREVG